MELISSIPERALRALPSGAAIIQNDECFVHCHGQKLHIIVHFFIIPTESRARMELIFSFQNQLFELYHLTEQLLKMVKLLKTYLRPEA